MGAFQPSVVLRLVGGSLSGVGPLGEVRVAGGVVVIDAELANTNQDLIETKARLSDLETRFKAVLGKLDIFRDVARM